MPVITNAGGGGGLDPDGLTAEAGDILKGKLGGVKGNDEPVAGTLELTGDAGDSHVMAGKTYYNTDAKQKRTGSIANNGAQNASLNCGQSKAIPAGYTTGGTVTANSLASQTQGTAAAADIMAGKTATVNGNSVTGLKPDRGAWTANVGMNGSVAVPEGSHNGSGKVNGPAIADRGAWGANIGVNGRVAIPQGYHSGGGSVGQSIAVQGGQTLTPSTAQQVVACSGKVMTGNIVVAGDGDLNPNNILNGKNIFGVAGNVRKSASLSGKTSTAGSSIWLNTWESGSRSFLYLKIPTGFTPLLASTWKDVNEDPYTCTWNYMGIYCILSSNYTSGQIYHAGRDNNPALVWNTTEVIIPVMSSGTYNYTVVGYY